MAMTKIRIIAVATFCHSDAGDRLCSQPRIEPFRVHSRCQRENNGRIISLERIRGLSTSELDPKKVAEFVELVELE